MESTSDSPGTGLRVHQFVVGVAPVASGLNGKKGKRRAIRPLRDLIPGRYDGTLPFGSRLNVTTLRFGLKRCGGEADKTSALTGDERLLHLYRGRS